MIAVHYAYWNQDEIPPDIDQVKWGDVEGTSGNSGFSSAINGIVNYCGAIVDLSWVDAAEAPVANFHGLLDTVVAADSGVSVDFGIKLYGGVAISRVATQLGIYNQGSFFPQMGHGGNEDSLRVFSSNFLYSLMVLSSSEPKDFVSMELSAELLKLFRYDTYAFLTTALDTSGNRVVLPHSWVQYSCDTKVGSMESYGLFSPWVAVTSRPSLHPAGDATLAASVIGLFESHRTTALKACSTWAPCGARLCSSGSRLQLCSCGLRCRMFRTATA